jgi:hypothetical protein
MSWGVGRYLSAAVSRGRLKGQAWPFLLAGGRPTPKLLCCPVQSTLLNQSPAGSSLGQGCSAE